MFAVINIKPSIM